MAGWLDPTVAGLAPSAYAQRVTELTAPTMRADLLIAVGKNRLLHVEYETSPRKSLVTRMYNYRGRIMVLYPQAQLAQYVIVLGDGRVRGHDRPSSGFTLDLNVVHLRERNSSDYLTDPVLAPLAALTRGSAAEREQAFAAALRLIRDSGHPMTGDLLLTAETLARIRLDDNTIDRIREENIMVLQITVDRYRNNAVGAYLERVAREEMLLARLQERFGDRTELDALAKKLAERPNREASTWSPQHPTSQPSCRPKCRAERQRFLTALSTLVKDCLASPKSRDVLGSYSNSFSMPAKPGRMERFRKMTCWASPTSRMGMP